MFHNHSIYSYKKAISEIDDIVNFAKSEGLNSFCITDLGSVKSYAKAFKIAKESGMKFIPGYEVLLKPDESIDAIKVSERIKWLKNEMKLKRTTKEAYDIYAMELEELEKLKTEKFHTAILIAKNQTGLENIFHIFNSEVEEGDIFKSDINSIKNHAEGIICLMGGLTSPLIYHIRKNDIDAAEKLLMEWKDTFGEDFYLLLEHHDEFLTEEQECMNLLTEAEANSALIELSERFDIPLVADSNSFYPSEEKRLSYRLFKNLYDDDLDPYNSDGYHLMGMEDIKQKLLVHYGDKWNDQIIKAAEMSNALISKISESTFPSSSNFEDMSKEITDACTKGWEKLRKNTEYEQESLERFKYELSVINDKNFSQYFIKVKNICDVADSLDIMIGPGRGSGCGSEICYLTGITNIDPLRYHLYFERFLNPDRNGYPDIDLDMSTVPGWAYEGCNETSREILMKELIKRGYFKFAGYIQNEVTASTLVLFKALAKYCNIPFEEANKISTDKVYSEKLKEDEYSGWLREAVEEYHLDWEDHWDLVEERIHFCYDLNGIPYNSSVAASGVIMSDKDVVLPVRYGGITYNGSDLESYNYIKYDLLSVDTLNQLQYFKNKYQSDVDLWHTKTDDPLVWNVISSGDTDFVFQFSSPGMKDIIMDVKPQNVETLAEINALYRPGPIGMGLVDKYKKLKRGEDPELNENELIISEILKREFGDEHTGLVIYQEDVMKICQIAAGFTLSEADDIRKAMGKKKPKLLEKYRERFISNWKLDGDPVEIWKSLEGFGSYAFNKSHAIAYSVIAYHTAKSWTYNREELLEYNMNYNTKERFNISINKCKELGMRFNYPTISNMMGDKYAVNSGNVYLPGYAEKNFSSYVDFLFDSEVNVPNLIYKGVCDNLTKDRFALATLVNNVMKKAKDKAIYMEPEGVKFNNLEQILDGLKACDGIVDWKKTEHGIYAYVRKLRTAPLEILFHNDNSDYVRVEMMKYDTKMFGSIRNGILSNLPYINTVAIEKTLETLKERMYASGKGSQVYYKLRDRLNEYMRDYFSSEYRNTFHDVYCKLEDIQHYATSTKIVLRFNDRSDIFYIRDRAMINCAKNADRNSILKLKMKYSPFIQKRTEKFIYDFDILEMEDISKEVSP